MKTKFYLLTLLLSAALTGQTQAGGRHNGGGGRASGFSGARSGPQGHYSGRYSPYMTRSTNFAGSRQFTARNFNGTNRFNHFGNNQHFTGNRNNSARNAAVRNRTNGQFNRSANNLRPGWQNHVIAKHSAASHPNWDRRRDHFFHGHRFIFINGFWFGFPFGFDPWWPYWYYPYPPYYGYYPYGYEGNPYEYGYGPYQGEPSDQYRDDGK